MKFGSANGSLLGDYFVQFNYFPIAFGSINSSFYHYGVWYNKSLDSTPFIWHSVWVYMSINTYLSNIAFYLDSNVDFYFANANMYSFQYTLQNNQVNGKLDISGNLDYLTNFGLYTANNILSSISLYNSTTLTFNSNTYTDTNGYAFFEIPISLIDNQYGFRIEKTNSAFSQNYGIASDSNFLETFEESSITSLVNHGWYIPGSPYTSVAFSSAHFYSGTQSITGTGTNGYSILWNTKNIYASTLTISIESYSGFQHQGQLYFYAPSENMFEGYFIDIQTPVAGNWMVDMWSFYQNPITNLHNNTELIGTHAGISNSNDWDNMTIVIKTNHIFNNNTIYLYVNSVLQKSVKDSSYTSGYTGLIIDNSYNSYFDNFAINELYSITNPTELIFNAYSQSQISFSVSENIAAFVISQDLSGGNLYANVYMDDVFQGVYKSGQPIYKSSSIGTHTFSYKLIAADDYIIGGASFVNSTYSVVNSDIESLVFRDQQGLYIDPNTFNVFVDGSRTIGGSFFVSDTSRPFNLTITDAWNYTAYSNPSETYLRIKDVHITLYSVKIQNYQSDPVWVQLQRGSGATFSQWVFSQEVVGYELLGGSYTLTYHFATVNSSTSLVNINNTSYTSYNFDLNDDIAFRITGISLQDIFSNIASVFNYVNTTAILLKSVNVSIGDLGNQTSFDFKILNSNMSVFTNILNMFNSSLDGNFSIFTQTLSIAGQLQGDFSSQNKFLDIVNSSMMGNLSLLSEFLNISSSIIKGGNITLQTQLFDFINSTLNGNLTLVAENSINTLAQLKNINATLLNQLAFQVIVSNFYLSDNFVNIYAVSTKNFQYSVYENNTLVTSGSGFRAGTVINYPRNVDPGSLVFVSIKFLNGTNSVWYNTSYTNGLVSTNSLNLILVSPGGIVLNPFPVLTYVNYSYISYGKVYVNKTDQLFDLAQTVNLPNNTLVTVTLKSGFGDLIYNNTFHLTSDNHLTIQVNITTLTISNSASTARIVELWRHNVLGYNATINPGESISIELLPTSYLIKVYSVLDTPFVDQYNNTITKQLLDFTTMTLKSVGSHIDLTSGSSLNSSQIKSWISQINPENMIIVLVSAVVGALATVTFGEMAKRIATQRFREKEREINDVETFRR